MVKACTSLKPRPSVPDFVSQLWIFLQSCETKFGTESLGSTLGLYQHAVCPQQIFSFFFFFAHPTAVLGLISKFARADIPCHIDDPWYHGDISSWEAEKRLTAKVSDCFLVRKSQSQPGNYTLSVKCEGVVKHFLVHKEHGCYEVDATETAFKSLEELVDYYKHHHLSAKGEKLTTPCLNPGV